MMVHKHIGLNTWPAAIEGWIVSSYQNATNVCILICKLHSDSNEYRYVVIFVFGFAK